MSTPVEAETPLPAPRLPLDGGPAAEWLLTPGEVAALYRVDPKTVTRWAADGWPPAVRTPGRKWRFKASAVARALGVPASQLGAQP